MSTYLHLHKKWPAFTWEHEKLLEPLAAVRYRQGKLLGSLENLGFRLKEEANLETLTLDVLKSSEIEGEHLPVEQVRSSVARRLGIDVAGVVPVDRNVDGVVEMMLDATQHFDKKLTGDRLFGWHASLFPYGRSGMRKIITGYWRDDADGPMQVVSGPIGRERVHFEAPAAKRLKKEMTAFLSWFNQKPDMDPVLKAAVSHLWFVTVHPFDDGNGRIARAMADMQLARADGSRQRFYSMSAQIRKERNRYYEILETTQKGTLDVTEWLVWFIQCLDRSVAASSETLAVVLRKAKFWEANRTQDLNDRQRKMIGVLVDGTLEGKLTNSKWVKMTRCSDDTALRDIQDLVQKKLLEKEDGGGRSTSYRVRYR